MVKCDCCGKKMNIPKTYASLCYDCSEGNIDLDKIEKNYKKLHSKNKRK